MPADWRRAPPPNPPQPRTREAIADLPKLRHDGDECDDRPSTPFRGDSAGGTGRAEDPRRRNLRAGAAALPRVLSTTVSTCGRLVSDPRFRPLDPRGPLGAFGPQ